FAAAATYGRLSADNEFVACRSSGINLHVLFLPTVLLSLLAGGTCFLLINYAIPGLVRNLNEFVEADLGTWVQRKLDRPRGISLGRRYRIHADDSLIDPDHPERIVLDGVTFVESDGDEWVRFGTAQRIDLSVEKQNQRLRIGGVMQGITYYDRRRKEFFDAKTQRIGPNELPALVPLRVKYLTLNELLYYLVRPTEWHEVRAELERLRRGVGAWMIYDELERQWREGHRIVLADARGTYTFAAPRAARDPVEGELILYDADITVRIDDRTRSRAAGEVVFRLARGTPDDRPALQADLQDVRLFEGTVQIEKQRDTIGPIFVEPSLTEAIRAMGEQELLERAGALPGRPLARQTARLIEVEAQTVRHMRGDLCERLAFSSSVFVLVILAAVLGILFRGAHVMTAFGVSFVPLLVVILAIVMGKQLSYNAGTHAIGLAIIWSGLVLVAAVDGWTLTRALRR
ncbi:MAG: LptF/LptG family permease, partial [Planctomycetota bacterium]